MGNGISATFLGAVLVLTSTGAWASQSQTTRGSRDVRPSVIYGEDNRKDLYEVTDSLELILADSTSAVMKAADLMDLGGESGMTRIKSRNFGEEFNLCEEEPFREQPSAAFCSASLVAPDIMMTAGHCIENETNCAKTKFVFGFGVTSKGEYPSEIPTSEVYSCKSIIKREQVNSGADYALIRLDRNVKGHAPLAINRAGDPLRGTPLVVIGHPSGIPTKIAAGAQVRDPNPRGYFTTNLDTYGGNSGSAVFNSVTGLIEGILVRGERDFVRKDRCYVSNRCDQNGCRGEDVTKISLLTGLIPELK